uniref:ATP-dependent DNA helicase RecG n=1 Tax=Mesoaciditoga lauensis TaxID=1495039 RepID=A0A7V3REQ6_9BACT
MPLMLFEDFINSSEEKIKDVLTHTVDVHDFESFLKKSSKNVEGITDEVKERFLAFCDYFSNISSLPEERRNLRLNNGLLMIEKIRSENLISLPPAAEKIIDLDSDIKYAKKIGPSREEDLSRLNIYRIRDLFYHFPRLYDDWRRSLKITELQSGQRVSATAKIVNVEKVKVRNFKIVTVIVTDGFSNMYLVWFNQEYLYDKLVTAKTLAFSGIVKNENGKFKVYSPDFEIVDENISKISPIYDLTSGISQGVMRSIIEENVQYINAFKDPLPDELLKKRKLLDLRCALYGMHFPKSEYHLNAARRRLIYDEFFLLELSKLMIKNSIQSKAGISKAFTGVFAKKFISSLPFNLTMAQKKAISEIEKDLRDPRMMNRLLHGDVGSGKTVVAEIAALDTIESGFQVAFMAPTFVLASQHYERITSDLSKFGIKSGFLSGSTLPSEKQKIKDKIQNGELNLIIGTHALIQKDVIFKNLGLVIIDEQHKFGVKQRETLMSKGRAIDTLVMTATPIPRTLSMTLYGDLDVTVIDEMPKGRKNPKTFIVNNKKREEVYEFVKQDIAKGAGVFWIAPLIEESDKMDLSAVTKIYEEFKNGPFTAQKVALLHGRMTAEEKEEVMEKFLKKEIDLLVSTTVIEVGIDIPHAGAMIIEHPERFGLAQLHQLRGRVGRGGNESFCILLTNGSELERLRYFTHTFNGFDLAEYDLKLRGPGEFMGTRQHGMPEFKVANLVEDEKILLEAREDAIELMEKDQELSSHGELLQEINRRYGEKIKFVEVG